MQRVPVPIHKSLVSRAFLLASLSFTERDFPASANRSREFPPMTLLHLITSCKKMASVLPTRLEFSMFVTAQDVKFSGSVSENSMKRSYEVCYNDWERYLRKTSDICRKNSTDSQWCRVTNSKWKHSVSDIELWQHFCICTMVIIQI